MKKKILILSLLLFTVALTACKVGGVKGKGEYIGETRELESFDKIEISGGYTVKIVIGEGSSIEIEAEENLLKLIRTRVMGNTLKIDSKKDLNPRREIELRIYTEELTDIEIAGSSNLDVINIDCDHFTLDLAGAANADLSGKAEKFTLSMAGAGNVNSKELICDHVRAELAGACNAVVYADESLKAEVAGVGNLDYYGDPADVDTDISGVGKIERK